MRSNGLFALLLVLAACSVAHAETDIYTTYVEGTWTAAGSPYRVHVEIQVAETNTLIIEPGVDVFFDDACGLSLDGCLSAVGTTQDSIRFAAANQFWTGIHIYGANWDVDSTRIEHCVVTGSSSGGISCETAFRVSVRHCRISENISDYGGGILIYDSTPVITDNLIKNNYSYGNGGGIYVYENSTPLIARNTIINNECKDSGGGIGVANCIPLIYGNRIEGNHASYVGGGIFLFNSSAPIVNNIIFNNTGYLGGGVCVWSGSPPYLTGNLICNNTGNQGGGLYSFSGNGISIVNDTVCNNYADEGGGICLFQYIDVQAVNCIFWGNQAETYNEVSIGELCTPNFTNCCIEGGYAYFGGTGMGGYDFNQNVNISTADPQFSNPASGAGAGDHCPASGWKLTDDSPCIDAGAMTDDPYLQYYDLFGSPRISGGGIDLGAIEWQYGQSDVASETQPIPEPALDNFPNPFNPSTTLRISLSAAQAVTLEIFDLRGQKVRAVCSGNLPEGISTFVWDGTDTRNKPVSSGVYLYRLTVPGNCITKRMLLLK